MKLIRMIVRRERVAPVVEALRQADVPRSFVYPIHALGSGVDPENYRLSPDEGSAYTDESKIEVVVSDERVDELIGLARQHACTGHRGDGLIFVSNVERVVKIRTGEEGAVALV